MTDPVQFVWVRRCVENFSNSVFGLMAMFLKAHFFHPSFDTENTNRCDSTKIELPRLYILLIYAYLSLSLGSLAQWSTTLPQKAFYPGKKSKQTEMQIHIFHPKYNNNQNKNSERVSEEKRTTKVPSTANSCLYVNTFCLTEFSPLHRIAQGEHLETIGTERIFELCHFVHTELNAITSRANGKIMAGWSFCVSFAAEWQSQPQLPLFFTFNANLREFYKIKAPKTPCTGWWWWWIRM